MDLSNLNIKNLDHLCLVAGLCQEVGIAQIIDKLIPSTANDKIISTGKCLEAMILNGLVQAEHCICILNILKTNRFKDF